MSVLDYGDAIYLYMHTSSQCLYALDTVYHGALRFITYLKTLTHHCVLYFRVRWSALSILTLFIIYKADLGLLP